jgi:hypothetical protein
MQIHTYIYTSRDMLQSVALTDVQPGSRAWAIHVSNVEHARAVVVALSMGYLWPGGICEDRHGEKVDKACIIHSRQSGHGIIPYSQDLYFVSYEIHKLDCIVHDLLIVLSRHSQPPQVSERTTPIIRSSSAIHHIKYTNKVSVTDHHSLAQLFRLQDSIAVVDLTNLDEDASAHMNLDSSEQLHWHTNSGCGIYICIICNMVAVCIDQLGTGESAAGGSLVRLVCWEGVRVVEWHKACE